ncbi:MAG: hypothetical protein U0996_12530 [Planctomycetaceae bacterium]
MKSLEFENILASSEAAIGPQAEEFRYNDRQFWSLIGTHPLDLELDRLAAAYSRCTGTQRQTLRGRVHPTASWGLIAYVRRMSLRILATGDDAWLTSALLIASLENAMFDFRDSIVSLVIVRAAAEQMLIDVVPHFNKAIKLSSAEMKSNFINARDHKPSDVRDILRAFGPKELKPKRKKRNS